MTAQQKSLFKDWLKTNFSTTHEGDMDLIIDHVAEHYFPATPTQVTAMVQTICEHHEFIELEYTDTAGNISTITLCKKCGRNVTFGPVVSGIVNPGFIADAVNELLTYYTPKEIIDYININCIIANPPYTAE